MTQVAQPVVSLIQGVSQQPEALRLPSQCALQENCYPSPVDGLVKRHPIDHVETLLDGVDGASHGDRLVHWIDRDAGEQYVVVAGHKSIKVFELDGTEVPVHGPTGPGYAADFDTYLDLSKDVTITDPETFAGWTRSGNVAVPASTSGVGPLGYGTWRLLATSAPHTGAAYYGQTGPSLMFQKVTTFSVYFKRTSETSSSFSGLSITLRDVGSAILHTVDFDVAGGLVTGMTETNGGRGGWEDLPDDVVRLWVTVTDGSTGTSALNPGDALEVRIGPKTSDMTGSLKAAYVWGARLDHETDPQPYNYEPSSALRAVSIADYTFILNTRVEVAQNASVSSASWAADRAYLFIRNPNYKNTYRCDIKKVGGTDKFVQVKTWNGTEMLGKDNEGYVLTEATAELPDSVEGVSGNSNTTYTGTIKTDEVAQNFVDRFNSVNKNPLGYAWTKHNYSTNGILADGWNAERSGSVVKVYMDGGVYIDTFKATDSFGDNDMVLIRETVDNFDDLPLVFEDGERVRINGNPTLVEDDYYVEFDADEPGEFINGQWRESIGFSVSLGLDPDTMPWQLVRKQDDVGGTVTGTSLAKYFEWAPAEWSERTVGDETSNPDPSFVGTTINDIFFFRARLGFLSGPNLVLSEAGNVFNVFRTSVRTLLDTDPIDIEVQHTSVVTLRHAAPFNDELFLFSDLPVFRVRGEPILSPKTIESRAVFDTATLTGARPIPTSRELLFTGPRGGFSSLLSITPSAQTERFNPDEASAPVPRYIEGDVKAMAANTTEGLLAIAADGEPDTLALYKFYYAGDQKLQAAWFKYTIDGVSILGLQFYKNDLYLVLQREFGIVLEKSTIVAGFADEDVGHYTCLDRRFAAGPDEAISGVWNGGATETQWRMPYDMVAGEEYKVVRRGVANPTVYTATINVTTGYLTVDNVDLSAVDVWIGKPYEARYVFSRPLLKSRGQPGATITGRYRIGFGTIAYADSFAFDVLVTPDGRATATASMSSDEAEDGRLRFGVLCTGDTVEVEVNSESPLPFKLEGAEWESEYSPKGARLG